MKRILILSIGIFSAMISMAQTTVTGDRVIAKNGFYLKDTWIDSIQRGTDFNGQTRALPTSEAVRKYVEAKIADGGGMGAATLDGLTDVVISSTGLGDELYFDSASSIWKNRGRHYVNILDYGAIGDGIFDNSTALSKAIASGKNILIPQGRFAFSSGFTLAKGQVLFGLGDKSVMAYTGTTRAITVDSASVVMNLKIEGSGKSAGNPFATGVFCYDAVNWMVEGCTITGFSGVGSQNGGGAILCVDMGAANQEGGRIVNCRIDSNNGGIVFNDRGEYVLVTGCQITNNNIGLGIGAGNVYVSNCNVEMNVYGLKMFDGVNDGHGFISNTSFNHNTINEIKFQDVGEAFSNCGFYYGALILENNDRIRFNQCDFSALDSVRLVNNTRIYRSHCVWGRSKQGSDMGEVTYLVSGESFRVIEDVALTSSEPRFAWKQLSSIDTIQINGILQFSNLPTTSTASSGIVIENGIVKKQSLSGASSLSSVQEVTSLPASTGNIAIYQGSLWWRDNVNTGTWFKAAKADSLTFYDSDAEVYFSAIQATGASLTQAQKLAYSNWVKSEKTAGRYSKYTAIYPMIGGTMAAHAINAKTPGTYNLTFSGNWVHDASGADPDGADATYATTGVSPNMIGLNNIHISAYVNQTGDGYFVGVYDPGASLLMGSFGTTLYHANNASTNTSTISSTGYFINSRTGASNYVMSKAGTTEVVASTSVVASSSVIRLGNIGNPPGSGNGSIRRIAFATVGTGLTSSECDGATSNMTTLQTSLGRN